MSNGPTGIPVAPIDFGSMADMFSQAKNAISRIPDLENQISAMTVSSQADGSRIASLEQRIHAYQNQVDALEASKRSLEVERDDAGFRVLELEERLHHIADGVRGAMRTLRDIGDNTLGSVLDKADPPKPEPELAAKPTTEASDPHDMQGGVYNNGPVSSNDPSAADFDYSGNPAVNVPITETHDEVPRPYANKLYSTHPTHIPLSDWLDGGGTEGSYYR